MQLRLETAFTSERYVSERGWESARLERCPLHPRGGCGFARHGTYARVEPAGTQIARWYCRQGRTTFSLLPDALASRLSSTLAEVEQVLARVEGASSIEQASAALRPDITLPSAVRWVRRRLGPMRSALLAIVTLLGLGCAATLGGVRASLGSHVTLAELRARVAARLASLGPPLGLGPRGSRRRARDGPFQHKAGPDGGGRAR